MFNILYILAYVYMGWKEKESYFGIESESEKVKSLSRVRLFTTPWTVAHQAPPSTDFSGQEYWSGLPFPSPEIFPTQGSKWGLPHCRQMLYCLSHRGISILNNYCFPTTI